VPALVAPPDPRLAPSLLAVERALAWYLDEVPHAQDPPLTAAEARGLRLALAGEQPWQPEQFDRLVAFAQAMFRLTQLDASVPACNLGDALTALTRVDLAGPGAPRWQFEPAVDRAAFAKLEFRETSLGIAKAQREHREGWWAHAQKNRAFIEQAVAASPRRGFVVALGAGHAFDLPLAALARGCDRLLLVDIDETALAETAAALAREAGVRARIETCAMDLTGINGAFVGRLDEAFAGAPDASAAEAAVTTLCRSYRLPAGAQLLAGGERADVIISSCVLTQLAWPQRTYAERSYEARHGAMPAAVEQRFATAFSELGLRVQQDHINALGAAADTVVLTSDVVSHPTRWEPAGERPTGRRIFALAVETLAERIPRLYRSGQLASWRWSRYRASRRGGEGSTMDVEAAVLGEPRSAGGLWLPGAA
jgi:hypothetical protein